ncbi:hypothetical protein MTR67_047927 [Solanum verrucosum]|uniref:Uncharacterized protein n=1 Tax=Solanum verrucosum TaxID=315347 RepID=A0AAF0ZW18_SOLVR|nr:hypothetical protein MTR67_047927 [Solanum verrucosum]
MQNYGHEQLNSRTFEYNLKRIRNSILKKLELKDTTLSRILNLWSSCEIMGMKNSIQGSK